MSIINLIIKHNNTSGSRAPRSAGAQHLWSQTNPNKKLKKKQLLYHKKLLTNILVYFPQNPQNEFLQSVIYRFFKSANSSMSDVY